MGRAGPLGRPRRVQRRNPFVHLVAQLQPPFRVVHALVFRPLLRGRALPQRGKAYLRF
jgi:hypothetical protein